MANPAALARQKAQTIWPGAVVAERGRGHIKHRHPTESNRFMLDTQVGGVGWHYGPLFDQEVDTAWEPAVAPWQYKMVKAEFNAYLLSRLDAGMVGRYTDPNTGEYVEFDPQNLQWTNDLNQIQPIDVPKAVDAVIIDDLATWSNGYGTGRHFSWQAQTARFEKLLTIDSWASLPNPNATIRSGGNPALELQLTFRRSAGVEIWINGVLWNQAGNNPQQTSGLVEFRQTATGQVLWWFNLPRSWDSNGKEVIGTFWFKRQGPNLNVFHRIPLSWIEDPTRVWPVKVDTTLDVQVGASADDDIVQRSISQWGNTQTLFFAGNSNESYKQRGSYGRFTGVNIPAGATGSVAYATLQALSGESGTIVRSDLCFENANNPSQTSSYADHIGRTRTVVVEWDNIAVWITNTDYQTPSIVTPLQAVIDAQSGTGDALILFWEDRLGESNTGAMRIAKSYDSSTTYAPKLHIEYTAGGISLTPTPLAVSVAIPAPTFSFGTKSLAPDPVAMPTSIPAPTLSFGAKTLIPSALAMPMVAPSPTLTFGAKTLSPDPLAISVAMPAPILSFGAKAVAPSPLAVPVVVPTPTLSFGTLIISPTPVMVPVVIPAPTLGFGIINLIPTPISMPVVVPTPILTFGVKALTPSVLATPIIIPSPTLSFGAKAIIPDPLTIPVSIPSSALSFGAKSLTPDPLAIPIVVPSPTILFGPLTLGPDPVAVPVIVPTPALTFGVASLTPQPVAAVIVLPAPVITVGAAATPTPRGAPFISLPAVSPRRRWPLIPDGVMFFFLFDLRLTTRRPAEVNLLFHLLSSNDVHVRMLPDFRVVSTVTAMAKGSVCCFLPGYIDVEIRSMLQAGIKPVSFDFLARIEKLEKRLGRLEIWQRNLDDELLLALASIS